MTITKNNNTCMIMNTFSHIKSKTDMSFCHPIFYIFICCACLASRVQFKWVKWIHTFLISSVWSIRMLLLQNPVCLNQFHFTSVSQKEFMPYWNLSVTVLRGKFNQSYDICEYISPQIHCDLLWINKMLYNRWSGCIMCLCVFATYST